LYCIFYRKGVLAHDGGMACAGSGVAFHHDSSDSPKGPQATRFRRGPVKKSLGLLFCGVHPADVSGYSPSILNARKAEREAEEQRERERRLQAELEAASELSPEKREEIKKSVLEMFPDADPAHVDRLIDQEKDNHLEHVTGRMVDGNYPKSKLQRPTPSPTTTVTPESPIDHVRESIRAGGGFGGGFLSTFRQRFTSSISRGPTPSPPPSDDGSPSAVTNAGGDGLSKPGEGSPPPNPAPTSIQDIRKTVFTAVSACKGETVSV
jgi:hypothetical protein